MYGFVCMPQFSSWLFITEIFLLCQKLSQSTQWCVSHYNSTNQLSNLAELLSSLQPPAVPITRPMGVTGSGRWSRLHGELPTKTAGGSAHVPVGTTAQYPVTADRAVRGGAKDERNSVPTVKCFIHIIVAIYHP